MTDLLRFWITLIGLVVLYSAVPLIAYIVLAHLKRLRADCAPWRKEAEAALARLEEVKEAIQERCEHYDSEYAWCEKYDQVAECLPCFVQGHQREDDNDHHR